MVEEVADHANTIRLKEVALKEKQIDLETAKLELRKRKFNHQFALKQMELEMSIKAAAPAPSKLDDA